MPYSPDNASRQHDTALEEAASFRVCERLVNPDRRISHLGTANVDNTKALSESLAVQVTRKAFKLKIMASKGVDSDELVPYEGQVGIIRLGPVGNFSFRPVTAKHNVTTQMNSMGELEQFDSATLFIPDGRVPNRIIRTTFPVGGQIVDHSEIDIAWGNAVRCDHLRHPNSCFELARSDFVYEEGQHVGMAIYSDNEVTPEASQAPPGYTKETLVKIYGRAHQVNILTGKVTAVDENMIVYDMNSFGGCSGAIIFLLDKDQRESVRPEDVGKAIAIHSGPHWDETLNRNVAFKLIMPDRFC
jgi:hypothetical protein